MKGRPPVIPRIEAIERRVTDLEQAVLELTERLKIPPVDFTRKDYEAQFTHWPDIKNGS